MAELKTSPKKELPTKRTLIIECSSDEEQAVFNYMTGLYENVKKKKTSSDQEITGVPESGPTAELVQNGELAVVEIVADNTPNDADHSKNATSGSRPTESTSIDGTKPSSTIDLTGDNISDPNSVTKVFIQHVVMPQSKTLTNPQKTKSFCNNVVNVDNDNSLIGKNISRNQYTLQFLDNSIRDTSIEVHAFHNTKQLSENVVSHEAVNNNRDNSNSGQSKVTCQVCGWKAISRQQLLIHLCEVHLQDEYSVVFKCKICNFETDHKKSMFLHERKHGNIDTCDIDDVTLSENVKTTTIKKKFISNNAEDATKVKDKETTDFSSHLKESRYTKKYKCFDCDYMTRRKSGLEDHATKHLGSTHRCNEHTFLDNDCLACVYKDCLKKSKNKMQTCDRCGYSTYRSHRFRAHKCSSRKPGLNNSNIDLTNSGDDECVNTGYYRGPRNFRCLSCDYVANRKDHLTNHVIRHLDTKVTCTKHSESMKDCDWCIYQSCVSYCLKNLKTCNICGFQTNKSNTFKFHNLHKHPDSGNQDALHYKCFDCNFSALGIYRLKCHAFKHRGSIFTCPDHVILRKKCLKCIYMNCLLKSKTKMYTCNKCGYKTYKSDRMREHEHVMNDCSKSKNRKSADESDSRESVSDE